MGDQMSFKGGREFLWKDMERMNWSGKVIPEGGNDLPGGCIRSMSRYRSIIHCGNQVLRNLYHPAHLN